MAAGLSGKEQDLLFLYKRWQGSVQSGDWSSAKLLKIDRKIFFCFLSLGFLAQVGGVILTQERGGAEMARRMRLGWGVGRRRSEPTPIPESNVS